MILFYGDPHGEFDTLFAGVKSLEPKAVVILGDFELDMPLSQKLAPIIDKTDIWFIHGNHDTDSDDFYDYLFNDELANKNLNGRVVEIDGYKVAGLGGVFRRKVWDPSVNPDPIWRDRKGYIKGQSKGNLKLNERYHGMPRKHYSTIWRDEYDKLAKQSADILVTHEAPQTLEYGFEALGDLAGSIGAHRHFHGHHHQSYSATMANGVIVEGVALAGLKNEFGIEVNP